MSLMKLQRVRLLLAFFLPVLIFTSVAGGVGLWWLYSLSAQASQGAADSTVDLQRLESVARLNQDLGKLQQELDVNLAQAASGALSEAQLYLQHTELVTRLDQLDRELAAMETPPQNLPRLQEVRKSFSAYRDLAITASDLAVIDPAGALRQAYAASRAQVALSLLTQAATIEVTRELTRHNLDNQAAMQSQAWLFLLLESSLGAMVLLGCWFAFDRLTRDLSRLGDNMRALAGDTRATLDLERVRAMADREGPLGGVATAVLAFQDAIVRRNQATEDLQQRVNEITSLLEINRQTERGDLSVAELMAEVAVQLRAALRQAEHCVLRIEWDGQFFEAKPSGDAELIQASTQRPPDLSVALGHQARAEGSISVWHLAAPDTPSDDVNFAQERALVEAVALRLTAVGEKRRQRRSQERAWAMVQSLVEQAPYAITLLDPASLKFELVNASACRLLGYDRSTLMGMSLHQLMPHDRFEAVLARGQAVLRQGDQEFDQPYQRADGSVMDVHGMVGPMELDGHTLLFEIWADVTAEKAMAAELDQHRHHLEQLVGQRTAELEAARDVAEALSLDFRRVLDASPDVIVLKDAQHRVKALSRTYREMRHLPDGPACLGRTMDELLPPDLARSIREEEDDQRRSGDPLRSVERQLELRGELRTFVFSRSLLRDEDGAFSGFLVMGRDLTERKRFERELEAAKEAAEAANQSKSTFLANMSHEIRTPMNAIIGMTELALQMPLQTRQRNHLHKVMRAAQNLLGIINDILDFSKIEAGKMGMERIEFRLEDVLDNLVSLVSLKTEEKGLELLFDADPDVPTSLLGDPLRLGQVLLNLGNNAVKFTERGEIVIGVRTVAHDGEEVRLHFWVRDTGIGMSAEQCERLFQSFSQADSSTTRKYGGSGLGLAISKRLVEMMDGRIWVESQPGVGSVFHFEARFGVQQGQAVPRQAQGLADFNGVRALVVDDNPTAGEVLSGLLRRLGLTVELCLRGDDALARLRQAPTEPDGAFRVLMVDWMMPGTDGIELLKQVQATPSDPKPAAVLVTAYGRDDAQDAAQLQGVHLGAVLTKPVIPSQAVEALAQVLRRSEPGQDRPIKRSDIDLNRASLAGARLLLVEDNDLNQELALELLRQARVQVELVDNGQKALDWLAADADFDGVLMDCQMPVMDGYEATRRIRRDLGLTDLPILAMTASAMAGDREKVLEAGMNDHIAKPLDVRQMFATLSKWMAPAPHRQREVVEAEVATPEVLDPGAGRSTPQRWPDVDGLDVSAGLGVSQGRTDLYARLLRRFAQSQADFLSRFEAARQGPDPAAMQRLAHTLKGVAGNIGAKAVYKAAMLLEEACAADHGPGSDLTVLLQDVEVTLTPLLRALERWDQTSGQRVALAPAQARVDRAVTTVDHALQVWRKALESGDPACVDQWFEHQTAWRARLAGCGDEFLKETEKALLNFDFERVLALLSVVPDFFENP